MTGINLFEQQARAAQAQASAAARETPLLAAMRFIEGANLSQCAKVAAHLSARLFTLEKMHGGMKAANLNEAAQFVANAVLDIGGALAATDAAPCTCGRCEDCAAARADEHRQRRRDGRYA